MNTDLDIEQIFWKIHDKVKNKDDLKSLFVNAVGGITGIMMMGFIGWYFWLFTVASVNLCYDYEPLHDTISRIGTTKEKREEFVIKLTEKLGYKDNWRKMYIDLNNGVFNLDNTFIQKI